MSAFGAKADIAQGSLDKTPSNNQPEAVFGSTVVGPDHSAASFTASPP
jgi:hypothetical protein